MSDDLEELKTRYRQFVEARNWNQYHTPQNLAIALSVEANELLENFLWFNNPESAEVAADPDLMSEVEDEIADVIIYALALAEQLDIDLKAAVEQKIENNESRFDEERVEQIAARLEKWQ